MRTRFGFVVLAAVVTFAGCGGADERAASVREEPLEKRGGAPVKVVESAPEDLAATPAAQASPTPGATATATATPAATPAVGGAAPVATVITGGADADDAELASQAGDEGGLAHELAVTITPGRIVSQPGAVPAFFPLTVGVRNTLDRDVTVLVMQAGEGHVVARVEAVARKTTVVPAEPLQPGTAEILSPDLDPDATAILQVDRPR